MRSLQARFVAFTLACLVVFITACSSGATSAPTASPGSATSQPASSTSQPVGPNLAALRAKGTLTVGTSFDFPPYEYVDASGNKVGFDIDYMSEIMKRLGLKVNFVDMPFDTLIPSLQTGKIDLTISTYIATAAREKIVTFTNAYTPAVEGWIAKADSNVTMSSSKDAAKYRIGSQTGGTNEQWIRANLIDTGLMPASKLSVYENQIAAIQDLIAGRVDVVVTEANTGNVFVKDPSKGLKFAYLDKSMGGAGYQIPLPLTWTDVRDAMNVIQAQLEAEGFTAMLGKKWGLQGY